MSSVDGGMYDAINAMRSDLANKANQHRLLAEQLLTEVTNHHELKHCSFWCNNVTYRDSNVCNIPVIALVCCVSTFKRYV
jgi:hypothetical protein